MSSAEDSFAMLAFGLIWGLLLLPFWFVFFCKRLNQGWPNVLTHVPQRVLKSDRRTRPGAHVWNVLVIHLIRERNSVESGWKHALVLIESENVYFKTDDSGVFFLFWSFCSYGLMSITEKCKLREKLHSCGIWLGLTYGQIWPPGCYLPTPWWNVASVSSSHEFWNHYRRGFLYF